MAKRPISGNRAVQFIRDLKKTDRASKRHVKLSRSRQPEDMPLDVWQRELRRQYGRNQKFQCTNIGQGLHFSEYRVFNPQSSSTNRVTLRGARPGDNHCTCGDFQTNLLGTCKHIECVLGRIERKPGGKGALASGFQPPYSEVFLHYGLQREVRFRPGLLCPRTVASSAAELFDADGALGEKGIASFEQLLAVAEKHEHEVRVGDDALNFIAERRDAKRRRERLAAMFPKGIRSPAFKTLLKTQLYDYQCKGALFVAEAGRALLSDEMGLGKTIQAIAAAEIMARAHAVERVLIVCPTSLKHQWEREIGRFSNRSVDCISGFRDDRLKRYQTPSFFKITNYDTVHRDLDAIEQWRPDLVILDEAQRIKNWETRTAKSVKKIASPYALVLTGTPIENRLEELVSIVQFIDRHRLGPTYRFLNDHQRRDENGRVVGYRDLDRIARTLEPIMLRRRKAEVLEELPARVDKTLYFPMTPMQQKHHEENRDVVAQIVAKWRRFGFLTEVDRRRLLIALQYMRMSCDSSFLIDKETHHGPKVAELATTVSEILEDPEAKVVVFSQWLAMLGLVSGRLMDNGIEHVVFHGSVESDKRRELINRFREDPNCRVFLSTDAGGVGLNLQFANVVVNLDLPWNPAVLEQRIGRVHRLGQTRGVRVFNFVSQATIEESMLDVLRFKKSMFAGILDGGEKNVMLGGSRLKKFMETVDSVASNIATPLLEPEAETDDNATTADSASRSYAKTLLDDARAEATLIADNGSSTPSHIAESASASAIAQSDLQRNLAALVNLLLAPSSLPGSSPIRPCIDEKTGETYLRLPMPAPEIVTELLGAIGKFLLAIRRD